MFLQGAPIDIGFYESQGFWDKVNVGAPDACWMWLQSVGSHGYGQTWDGKTVRLAHRVAWTVWHGEQIPEGMTIDHMCRVRTCVNPHHLRLLTNAENARSNGNANKLTCPTGHSYSGDNLRVNQYGHRSCRTCNNTRRRERRVA